MSGTMPPIRLDDTFVLEQLRPVANRWPALIIDPGRMARIGKQVECTIQGILRLFRKHYGLARRHCRPPEILILEEMLTIGLKIGGKVLRLERRLGQFKPLIETDWLAHVELAKQKRYRDHITHPIRVTAIGWWLLHRNREKLLCHMADHYQQATWDYRQKSHIEMEGYDWKAIVEYAWLACGLFHDSAYPLEYHIRTTTRLKKSFKAVITAMNSPPITAAQGLMLLPLSNSWFSNQNIDLKNRVTRLCERKLKHAHALLAALHHLHALGRQLHTRQGLVVQLAARAIATHHDQSSTYIRSDPLAVLLFIADNLQGWARPFLHRESLQSSMDSDKRTMRTIIECDKIELIPDTDRYVAQFWMTSDEGIMKILKKQPYKWDLQKFKKPNARVERIMMNGEYYPSIILSQTRCVQPNEFRQYMMP